MVKKDVNDHKATKYTNKVIVTYLMKKVEERLRLKIRRALVPLEERIIHVF